MKLELEFAPMVELSILDALEAVTDPYRAPEDVDLKLATQHLRILRDALRPRRLQIEQLAATTWSQSDALPY